MTELEPRRAFLLPLAAAGFAAVAFAAVESGAIEGYHRLDERVALGAAPSAPQVERLARQGFAAVITLREASEGDDAALAEAARAAGIRYLRVPVPTQAPPDSAFEAFLAVTDDASIYPVYVYCATGNRAAALWMVRRVLRDGWRLEDAEAEAVAAGLTRAPWRDDARAYIARHTPRAEAKP